MKKTAIIMLGLLLTAGCASTKNNLNARMEKYPVEEYITKVAVSPVKDTAKHNAAQGLKTLFDIVPSSKDSDIRRETILSKVAVKEWWKDKDTGKYYAIAVLERKPAQQIIMPYYKPIDGKLDAVSARINAQQDKYVRLKEAMQMPALLNQREGLDNEYRQLSFDASAFDEEKLYAYRALYNKTFYDIKINSVITGVDDFTVKTFIIDSLNKLGFAVAQDMPNCDIELLLNTKTDEYPSKTTDGLYWCTSTATVALKDNETKGIFATFSTTERAGSSRAQESQRRSLMAAGEKAAPIVKEKLLDYVETK